MPKLLLLTLLCFILLFTQCSRQKNNVFNVNELPASLFTINIDRDTIFHTPKGAIIHIPEHAFASGSGSTIQLEIKEAYTIADMILAGLTTKAGEDPLSSDGMIYVNVADKQVSIQKPISISMPTKHKRRGMQLYKGVAKADGDIDWTDPQQLATNGDKRCQEGKALFEGNCASCHKPASDATGPPLAFLDQRRDSDWLYAFIENPAHTIGHYGDKYGPCLYEHWGKTNMTAFPNLSHEQIKKIFECVNEQCNNDPATVKDEKKSFDSCQLYNELINALATKLTAKRNELVADNGAFVQVNRDMQVHSFTPPPGMVDYTNKPSEYYQVTIKACGWYNVDILTTSQPGYQNSQLMTRITGEYHADVSIYLVLPAQKVLLPGGKIKNSDDSYGFYTDDGQIQLPQNAKAYILAAGEANGQLYFGKTEFMTALKQSPDIHVSVTTKEAMNTAIEQLNIPALDVIATDSKNAAEIRKIDTSLQLIEKMKPKNWDCNCGVRERGDSDSASLEQGR